MRFGKIRHTDANKNLKVLQVGLDSLGVGSSGNLAYRLDQAGYSVDLLERGSTRTIDHQTVNRKQVGFNGPGPLRNSTRAYFAALARGRYDIVHLHGASRPRWHISAARIAGVPLVFESVRGVDDNHSPPTGFGWLKRAAAANGTADATFLEMSGEFGHDMPDSHRTHRVWVGMGADLERAGTAGEFGLASNRPRVLVPFAGGQAKLASGFAKSSHPILRKSPRLILDLLGWSAASCAESRFSDAVRQVTSANGMGANVDVQETDDPEAVFPSAEAIIFLDESDMNADLAMRAMAHGLLVIAAVGTPAAKVLTHGIDGFIVNPDSWEIADVLENALSNQEGTRTMRAAARQRAFQSFDLSRKLDRYLAGYEAVANHRVRIGFKNANAN